MNDAMVSEWDGLFMFIRDRMNQFQIWCLTWFWRVEWWIGFLYFHLSRLMLDFSHQQTTKSNPILPINGSESH